MSDRTTIGLLSTLSVPPSCVKHGAGARPGYQWANVRYVCLPCVCCAGVGRGNDTAGRMYVCMYGCHLLIINSVWPNDCLITVLITILFIIRYVIIMV